MVGQVDLAKLETEIGSPDPQPAEVARFAPAKYRDGTTLASLIAAVRKTREQLERDVQALEQYLDGQRRSIG